MQYVQQIDLSCPWCGESFSTQIDTSQGPHEHIEDCFVCCRPMSVIVECELGEIFSVETSRP